MKKLFDDVAPRRATQGRLHPHRQARPAQERFGAVAFLEWVDAAEVTVEETTPAKKGRKRKSAKGEASSAGDAKPAGKAKKSVPNEKEAGAEE